MTTPRSWHLLTDGALAGEIDQHRERFVDPGTVTDELFAEVARRLRRGGSGVTITNTSAGGDITAIAGSRSFADRYRRRRTGDTP